MTKREVERLRQVYAAYETDEQSRAHWDTKNPGNRAILRQRKQMLRHLLEDAGFLPLTGRRILDIGCGSGAVLAGLTTWGAEADHLYGVDLLAERIEAAQRRFPGCHFQQANAEALPFDDATFDLVLLFTVFTSILDEAMARNVAGEVQRVLKPGGGVVWYDFRYDNPRNPNVRGMPKTQIKQRFPGWRTDLCTTTLLPPLARRLGRLTSVFYPALAAFPFLRTHYIGLLIKP